MSDVLDTMSDVFDQNVGHSVRGKHQNNELILYRMSGNLWKDVQHKGL